jgi:tol-pal system protein YbgF
LKPFVPVCRASAAIVCLGLFTASAGAFDLNPFNRPPQQTAQSTLPPGAIPGGPADAGDPGALDVRIDRLEDELRQANGRIEQLENQQHRLEELIKRFQQDVEFRLGAGANPAVAAVPPVAPLAGASAVPPAAPLNGATPIKPPRKSDAFDPAADPNAAGAPRVLGTTPPSAPLATPPAPAGAPLNLSDRPLPPPQTTPAGPLADTGPTVIPGAGIGFTDGPRDQYNAAIDAYRNGQYSQAEEQLKAFLAANGSNRLAPDAVFYLGETYLQRSRPREAAEQYLKLSTDYAKSARAPEGMVRLGQSLAALGSNDQACATFAEVSKRYPTAATTVKKLAEREMQKNHC